MYSVYKLVCTAKIQISLRPEIRVCNGKLISYSSIKTYVVGTQKKDSSFEHPKHMFKLMDMKIITILHSKVLLNWPYESVYT